MVGRLYTQGYSGVAAWAARATPPTYVGRRMFQDGPETYMQQIWYLISVTSCPGQKG
jgi:hypothetical protein